MRSTMATAALVAARTGSLCVTTADAASILPTSYSMLNGDGQASGGSFYHWDQEYDGVGTATVDSAPLSGGLGNLTDGVIASQNWFDVENAAGTGPCVG